MLVVSDTMTNDPNITTAGNNSADSTALRSGGDGEGDSIYSDDVEFDWAEPDADKMFRVSTTVVCGSIGRLRRAAKHARCQAQAPGQAR
jgi:hypothetical protein